MKHTLPVVLVLALCGTCLITAQSCSAVPSWFFPYGSGTTDITDTPNNQVITTSGTPYMAFTHFDASGIEVGIGSEINLGAIFVQPSTLSGGSESSRVYASKYSYDSGTASWRGSTTDSDLSAAGYLINKNLQVDGFFNPSWVFVVTYVCMVSSALESTFQIVVASDGCQTFVVLNYHMLHDLEVANGGQSTNQFALFDAAATPDAITSDQTANKLMTQSNVGRSGQWIFDITAATPTPPNDSPNCAFNPSPTCRSCGGCSKIWKGSLRMTEVKYCGTPQQCVRGVDPKVEYIVNPNGPRRRPYRRIRRLHHCCYNYRGNTPSILTKSRPCIRVRGWTTAF